MKRLAVYFLLSLGVITVQSQPKQDAYSLGIQGILKVDNGDYKAGIKLLKRARNLEPKEYDYAFEIGKAYFKSGKPRTAEKYFFELQYHSSVQADLYVLLSRCYEELEALKKNPNPENKKAMDAEIWHPKTTKRWCSIFGISPAKHKERKVC
jgi:predicted Zn-dependent protease